MFVALAELVKWSLSPEVCGLNPFNGQNIKLNV